MLLPLCVCVCVCVCVCRPSFGWGHFSWLYVGCSAAPLEWRFGVIDETEVAQPASAIVSSRLLTPGTGGVLRLVFGAYDGAPSLQLKRSAGDASVEYIVREGARQRRPVVSVLCATVVANSMRTPSCCVLVQIRCSVSSLSPESPLPASHGLEVQHNTDGTTVITIPLQAFQHPAAQTVLTVHSTLTGDVVGSAFIVPEMLTFTMVWYGTAAH